MKKCNCITGNCKHNHRFTNTVIMLPHENDLMVEHPDGSITKKNDVTMLLMAEKYSSRYGGTYLNDIFGNPPKTSPIQESLDKSDDNTRMSSISSKYIQRPSEVKAYSESIIETSKDLQDSVVSTVKQKIATNKQKKQDNGTEPG